MLAEQLVAGKVRLQVTVKSPTSNPPDFQSPWEVGMMPSTEHQRDLQPPENSDLFSPSRYVSAESAGAVSMPARRSLDQN